MLFVRCELQSLGVNIRWSSTFEIIRKCFCVRHVLQSLVCREGDLRYHKSSEAKLKAIHKAHPLLDAEESATRYQSGSLYVTLSLNLKIFGKLKNASCYQLLDEDQDLSHIASSVMQKLHKCLDLVKTSLAKLANVLDLRFKSDVLREADRLSV